MYGESWAELVSAVISPSDERTRLCQSNSMGGRNRQTGKRRETRRLLELILISAISNSELAVVILTDILQRAVAKKNESSVGGRENVRGIRECADLLWCTRRDAKLSVAQRTVHIATPAPHCAIRF